MSKGGQDLGGPPREDWGEQEGGANGRREMAMKYLLHLTEEKRSCGRDGKGHVGGT